MRAACPPKEGHHVPARHHTTRRRTAVVASTLALGLGLAACASGETDSGSDSASAAPDKDITIAIHSGWDEGIAVSHLFKAILEDDGYTVKTETADPGIVYTGMAGGEFDLNFDMWLP
ncbi:glycine betaine ABC transporter substrate-binding protein [Oerskovia sp. M15]